VDRGAGVVGIEARDEQLVCRSRRVLGSGVALPFVRHLRFDRPLVVKMGGKDGRGYRSIPSRAGTPSR
jgi:hypothetical protein